MTRLSPNFILAELIRSRTALQRGLDNTPDDSALAALRRLTENILQPVRERFGLPFSPSSAYRSAAVNRAVGGSPHSQHLRGEAADFSIPGVGALTVAQFIRDHLSFDQLILATGPGGDPQRGWLHCSYRNEKENRRQLLTFRDGRYLPGLPGETVAV